MFRPLFEHLGVKPDDPRLLTDWTKHTLLYQTHARLQHDVEGKVVGPNTRGRPPTVFPLMETVRVPIKLLQSDDPIIHKQLMVSQNRDLSKPPTGHLFKHKKTTRIKDNYDSYNSYYFNPILLVAGPYVRSLVCKRFGFSTLETSMLAELNFQHDETLRKRIKKEAKQHTTSTTTTTTTTSADSKDDVDDDDDVPVAAKPKRQKRKHRNEEKQQPLQQCLLRPDYRFARVHKVMAPAPQLAEFLFTQAPPDLLLSMF